MSSHFAAIGFPIATTGELVALAERVAPDAERVPCPGGAYLVWRSGAGEELWLQLDDADELVGMNPHFAGRSRTPVRLTARVGEQGAPHDGAFHAWAAPEARHARAGELIADPSGAAWSRPPRSHDDGDDGDDGEGDDDDGGLYPFVFDCPENACHLALPLPARRTVQLAAFAHELEVHASEAAFHAAKGGGGLAARAFIPSGLFLPAGEPRDPPLAEAVFSGRVLASETRLNPLTGAPFVWAWVDSYGARFDLIAGPDLCRSALAAGSVVVGAFWLSGRLVFDDLAL